jgi:hypothetical protein
MKTLKVYSIKERNPSDGDMILLFGECYCFGDAYLEPKLVNVEYTWSVIDENGEGTGDQIVYDKNIEMPKDCRLVIISKESGYELNETDMYAIPDDVLYIMKHK